MADLLTIYEVAAQLGVRASTVRAWVRQGKLASVRLGKMIRIPETEVDHLISRNVTPPSRELTPTRLNDLAEVRL